MEREEVLLKEIDLIEACIKRMADNSFLIKGWTIAAVSGILTVMARTDNWEAGSGLAYLVCIALWGLDAYYLQLERLYRFKFDWILENRMETDAFMFNLNPWESGMWKTSGTTPNYMKGMLSVPLCVFYGTISILLLVLLFLSSTSIAIKGLAFMCICTLLTLILKK